MNKKTVILFAIIVNVLLILLWYYHLMDSRQFLLYYGDDLRNIRIGAYDVLKSFGSLAFGNASDSSVIIAVTCCGHELIEQTLVMMKSAIIFSSSHLHFVIMADYNKIEICEQILKWPHNILRRISFEIHTTSYPHVKDGQAWREAFAPCSAQRLFYPKILLKYDSVLHIDSDAIFFSPVEQLWSHFGQMNGTQLAALATEDMNPRTSYYLNHRPIAPYATQFALNAGIMAMNLTRMRAVNFFSSLEPIVAKYRDLLPWFDQDVLNVYFHDHPDHLYQLPCRWNFLTDHCASGPLCYSAQREGIALLHGSRSTFQNSKNPVFRLVYLAFSRYQFNTDLYWNLVQPIQQFLTTQYDTNCGKSAFIFVKSMEDFLTKNKSIAD